MSKFYTVLLSIFLMCCLTQAVQAAYIERTITIDGDMTDWYDTPPTYTPGGDITNNPGQFSTDGEDGGDPTDDLDEPVGSTGRDLKKFSFTWDTTYLYFYVERWASSTNVTDWWFYIDTDADGYMELNEKVFRVNWQGSNQRTNAELWDYIPFDPDTDGDGDPTTNPGSDPLTNAGVGDGYTMPGTIDNMVSLYSNVLAGAATGTEMESQISWANLGFTSPANLKFHISSSNGTNLPSNVLDNMDGPAGGQLFPQDLQISKSASVASEYSNHVFSYTVTVYNAAIIDFTNVVISDVIPSLTTYVNHIAEAGTTFDDTDANTIPDEWNIPSIPANSTYTLTINVKGEPVASTTTVTNTATLTASDQTDENATNDSASVDVDILPAPVLTMDKDASVASAKPGEPIDYSITVTNIGGASSNSVTVTDALSPYTMLGVDTYGALTPFNLVEGTPASGVTFGTITYSDDNGATFTYTPVSGGGGAPAGFDANVTNWNIEMSGNMAHSGANFDIEYQVQLR